MIILAVFFPDWLGEVLHAGFWVLLIPVVLALLLALPFRLLVNNKEHRKQRALRYARTILILLLAADVEHYLEEAYLRANLTERSILDRGISPDGLYLAKVYRTRGDMRDADTEGVLRVYSMKDHTLLAEKRWQDPEGNLYLGEYYIAAGLGQARAKVNLPPSWLDRLQAMIP